MGQTSKAIMNESIRDGVKEVLRKNNPSLKASDVAYSEARRGTEMLSSMLDKVSEYQQKAKTKNVSQKILN